MKAVINADGVVDSTSVVVLTGIRRDLDAAAVRLVREASFWPACIGPNPTRVLARIPIDFGMKETGQK